MGREQESLLDLARRAIGKGNPDKDWRVVPTEHADMFEEKAPGLARILRAGRPEALAKRYELMNDEASEARDRFKKKAAYADNAIFCTAVLGAALLMAGGLQEHLGAVGPWLVRTIGVLGLVSGGLAAMWLSQVRTGHLANRWADRRAKAEAKRLEYFKAVMEGASETPLDQLLVLEYTRRFLLDNQIDYFRERGAQHESGADDALSQSTRAVFASSTATGLAGLLAIVKPTFAVIAGLAVIASAYAALAASRSAINLDRRNADRYRTAEEELWQRRLDIDDYRARAAAGDAKAVQEFFEPVFVILQADHKQFLEESEQRELAIGGMERRLDAAKKALND